jgi:hypothetical protein
MMINWLMPLLVASNPAPSLCPTDFSGLSNRLIEDFPNYANRVLATTQWSANRTYVITAGQGEDEPLDLGSGEYSPSFDEDIKQLFFTSLDRHYGRDRVETTQNFHWLLLAPTEEGYILLQAYSQLGATATRAPLPIQDSNDGVLGLAVKSWLRDCNAGAIDRYQKSGLTQ